MLRIMLLAVVSSYCQLVDNESGSKFVAFIQEDSGFDSGQKFLIRSVHKPSWRIGIGFSDNNDCDNSFSALHKNELRAGISEALRVWLTPLADKANIVDNFNYVPRESFLPVPPLIPGQNIYLLRDSNNTLDLEIVIRCTAGRSFALRRGGRVSTINLFRDRIRPTVNNALTSLRRSHKVVLLHELGHAFGLGDTYVDQRNIFRYSRSDGGSRHTAGKQPLSIMNSIYLISSSFYQYRLADDDVAGIRWLYRYYIERNLTSIRDCPADFVYERNTKGCSPRYPLIFAVRQGDMKTIVNLLTDDRTIDLGQKDNLGNTALHHAAKRASGHGNQLYLFLRGKYSAQQRAIRNLGGQTAGNIYASGFWAGHFLLSTNSFLRDMQTDRALQTLEEALDAGYSGTVRRLTADSLNSRGQVHKNGLLYQAVTSDSGPIVDQLLKHPLVKINLSNSNGDRALHKLAILNREALARKFLARQDLEINGQNNNGDSALHVAARAGHVAMVRLLLNDSRIDTTLTNTRNKTARDVAEQKKRVSSSRIAGYYQQIMDLIDAHTAE